MKKKVLVTISRLTGAAGLGIGDKLAKRLGVPYYNNKNMAELYTDKKYIRYFMEAGEKIPTETLYGSSVSGNRIYDSLNEEMFQEQRNVTTELAEKGSAVFIGRCADYILEEYDGLVKVFLMADEESRLNNIMEHEFLTREEAVKRMNDLDNSRRTYYNYYTDRDWGKRENYHLVINTSNICDETVVNIIYAYINGLDG